MSGLHDPTSALHLRLCRREILYPPSTMPPRQPYIDPEQLEEALLLREALMQMYDDTEEILTAVQQGQVAIRNERAAFNARQVARFAAVNQGAQNNESTNALSQASSSEANSVDRSPGNKLANRPATNDQRPETDQTAPAKEAANENQATH